MKKIIGLLTVILLLGAIVPSQKIEQVKVFDLSQYKWETI